MKYRRLGKTGFDVSILSYGASALGGVYGEFDEEQRRAFSAAVHARSLQTLGIRRQEYD